MAKDKKENRLIEKLKARNARQVRREIRRLKFSLWLVGATRKLNWRMELDNDLDVYAVAYIENFRIEARRYKDYQGTPYTNYSVTRNNTPSLMNSCYWSDVADYIGKKLANEEYLKIMNR